MTLWEAARKTSLSLALAVIWGGAFFMTLATATQIKATVDAFQQRVELESLAKLARGELVTIPLTQQQYQQTRAWVVAMHEEAKVAVSDRQMTISVEDLTQYGLWRMAVLNALNSQPGARWQAVRACMGSGCGGGSGYTIELSGSTQQFVVREE